MPRGELLEVQPWALLCLGVWSVPSVAQQEQELGAQGWQGPIESRRIVAEMPRGELPEQVLPSNRWWRSSSEPRRSVVQVPQGELPRAQS